MFIRDIIGPVHVALQVLQLERLHPMLLPACTSTEPREVTAIYQCHEPINQSINQWINASLREITVKNRSQTVPLRNK